MRINLEVPNEYCLILKQQWNVVEIVTDDFRNAIYVSELNEDRTFSKRMDKWYSVRRNNKEYSTKWEKWET